MNTLWGVTVLCLCAMYVHFTVRITLYFKRPPETFKYYSSFADSGPAEVRAVKIAEIMSSRARTRTHWS